MTPAAGMTLTASTRRCTARPSRRARSRESLGEFALNVDAVIDVELFLEDDPDVEYEEAS